MTANPDDRIPDVDEGLQGRMDTRGAGVQQPDWQKMDTAPRDGRGFLVQRLPYADADLCMRRVKWVEDGDKVKVVDLGGWVIVDGIDDDFTEFLPTSGQAAVIVAPDHLNSTHIWRWIPLPQAPAEVLAAIRSELGWAKP